MKLIQIADFKLGYSIHGFYLCQGKQIRHTRNGDIFLDLIFSDSTGTITGKLWDLVDHFQGRFERGDPVAVKGKITQFNDHLQLTVDQINQATDRQYKKYGYSPKLIIRTVEEPVNNLWKNLMLLIESLHNPYRKITQSIFRSYEQKIKIMPKSILQNQQIRGEFLKRLVSVAEIAMDILPYYSTLDRDLVLCGTLLHDIGKVEGINNDLQPSYSDAGRLIGHVALGIDILKKASSSYKNFPEDILLKLEHILISHENDRYSKSLVVPTFSEALFIHSIYALDSRMNLMSDFIINDENRM